MKAPDVFILEFVAEDGPASPADLVSDDGAGLPFSRGYVNVRCQELEDREFLVNLGNGVYQLTDRGEEWLAGDFDARSLDEGKSSTASA